MEYKNVAKQLEEDYGELSKRGDSIANEIKQVHEHINKFTENKNEMQLKRDNLYSEKKKINQQITSLKRDIVM